MPWHREFPADFRPPAEVLAAPGLEDTSWGNDVCPSFMTREVADAVAEDGEDLVRLWVEHPDPAKRECGAPTRLAVYDHRAGAVRWEGEDPALAVVALRLWSANALFRRAADRGESVPAGDAEGPLLGESRR